MARKVGRNDPCPCGSGKKYKSCCLRNIQQPSAIPWPTFPEAFVIGELLRSSREFIGFYGAERGKIAQPVHWARDSSLPAGIDYRCTRLATGLHVIRLRRVPAVVRDAMKIAHELEHFVLDTEGFPCTGAPDRFETVSSALNSMVHDPIVDSRLQGYGFDLWEDYQRGLRETFRQLTALPDPPSEHLKRIMWIFNYVAKILKWEVASNKAENAENEFRLWFDARYPDVAAEGQELLALVGNFGYDAPDKQVTLFSEIIERYHLQRVLVL